MPPVLLCLVDGLRPDALNAAVTPNILALAARGSATLQARTVIPPITLPVHFSIFTSQTPVNHGVLTNAGRSSPSASAVCLLDWAAWHGQACALFHNWEPLRELSAPGSLRRAVFLNNALEEHGDTEVVRECLRHLLQEPLDLVFVYLGRLDEVAHVHGFLSTPYFEALTQADHALGQLLAGLEEKAPEERVIAFLSDHGGEGRDHDRPLPEVMTVPWMIAGPGIRQGWSIQSPVSVLDTTPTLSRVLGLPLAASWRGRVLEEVFDM
jgi:predicted AlkP superfamily pyrophosphatase or phosphodiesterase